MISFNSLESRLQLSFTVLSLIICVFFIRLSTLLIETAEMNAFQSVLAQEEKRIVEQNEINKLPVLQSMVLYENLDRAPNEILRNIGNMKNGHFETKEGQIFAFRIFTLNQKPHLLLMNINSLMANQHLSQYKSLFLYSISASVFILCILSAWYLAKFLSRPIHLLTKEVSNKGKAGVYDTHRQDEIGMLARALADSYKEVESLLLREQNFTRDVSHELRTPITLIKNTLAMQSKKALSEDEQALLHQASNELEQTVETLLALARQENLEFSELKVLPIVEKTILSILSIYPDYQFDIRSDIDPKMRVYGNPLLLKLLCQNLVNNGVYHGNGKAMHIYSMGQELIFENKIEAQNNRPYYQGLGHGQYLVKRIAEEMGWTLSIEQENNSYKVSILTKRQPIEG